MPDMAGPEPVPAEEVAPAPAAPEEPEPVPAPAPAPPAPEPAEEELSLPEEPPAPSPSPPREDSGSIKIRTYSNGKKMMSKDGGETWEPMNLMELEALLGPQKALALLAQS